MYCFLVNTDNGTFRLMARQSGKSLFKSVCFNTSVYNVAYVKMLLVPQGDFFERRKHMFPFKVVTFYIIQKKVLRLIHFKPQFHPSRELFFKMGFQMCSSCTLWSFLNSVLNQCAEKTAPILLTASIRHALMFMKRGV